MLNFNIQLIDHRLVVQVTSIFRLFLSKMVFWYLSVIDLIGQSLNHYIIHSTRFFISLTIIVSIQIVHIKQDRC